MSILKYLKILFAYDIDCIRLILLLFCMGHVSLTSVFSAKFEMSSSIQNEAVIEILVEDVIRRVSLSTHMSMQPWSIG